MLWLEYSDCAKQGRPAEGGRNLLDHWTLAWYPKVYLLQSGKGENHFLNPYCTICTSMLVPI